MHACVLDIFRDSKNCYAQSCCLCCKMIMILLQCHVIGIMRLLVYTYSLAVKKDGFQFEENHDNLQSSLHIAGAGTVLIQYYSEYE